MTDEYSKKAVLFKALSDTNRIMIVDMLSRGELCACMILEMFNITQPTLSHHMKILCDCNLVNKRKDGRWIYYSLDEKTARGFKDFLNTITTIKKTCCSKQVCDCEK